MNIKEDLLRKLYDNLYYLERDLNSMIQLETVLYSIRISNVESLLEKIAIVKLKIELVERYIPVNNEETNE